jgi:hypothetical protein
VPGGSVGAASAHSRLMSRSSRCCRLRVGRPKDVPVGATPLRRLEVR